MRRDPYDLVAIGATLAAREAALLAARHGRVAWVAQQSDPEAIALPELWEDAALQEAARAAIAAQMSPERVAAAADVVLGVGQFASGPTFVVGDRPLRARRYFLATGTHQTVPEVLRAAYAEQTSAPERVERVAVIGGGVEAAAVAQRLARLRQVTLVLPQLPLVPGLDATVDCLVRAQLEADGVEIVSGAIAQAGWREREVVLQLPERTLVAEAIELATTREPQLAGLALEALGVRFQPSGLRVDRYCQTSHRRIYACGAAGGGHDLSTEARVAVANALTPWWCGWRRRPVPDSPQAIATVPPLAWVGLSAAEARRRFGTAVVGDSNYLFPAAIARGETTGLCRLVARASGQVVGAQVFGARAAELAAAIALGIQQRLSLAAFAHWPVAQTDAEVVRRAAEVGEARRLSRADVLTW